MVASAWRLLESGILGGSQLCACSARCPLGATCALPAGWSQPKEPLVCGNFVSISGSQSCFVATVATEPRDRFMEISVETKHYR